ncbi:MAG TPA: hypothetical protein V6D18_17195 [Thermosynechococcaceae cyanobacterium]
MFDPISPNDPYYPKVEELSIEPEEQPADLTLEAATRFATWFSLGTAVTLLIRLLPALQPFYGIIGVAGLVGLALAIHFSRNVKLIAIAVLLVAATLAGHWDGLTHTAQQSSQQLQEVMK